ncbi:NAD(P)/FAD-dependent oxidoreductase [Niveispirillum fermenti]|uniref:NAD(P)/FAD-dependent oxidoreductase n=1 Tax=Niveispirillum fermenti TaxID=1233113 RepID=UPI003A835942
MQSFDIVIVGAGIAGASIASALVDAGVEGARILLAEREDFPGYHTTGRSAALYSALYGNETVCALTAASRAFYLAPPPGFTDHPLLTPRGCLYIAGEDAVGELDALEATAQRVGARTTRMGAHEARAMVPVLRDELVSAALWEREAMDIDVHSLHQGYLRRARAAGVVLSTGAELRAAASEGDGWVLTFGSAKVRAATLVNAAGAWADEVARIAGVPTIGLMPLRRTAIMLDPPAGADVHRWPAVIDAGGSFYFKPDAGMLLASPADETPSPPCDAQADEWDIAVCVDRVQAAAELPVRRVARSWAGLRSFVADRSPVVGRPAAHPGFFWFAGQGGYGIQMGPALALTGASLLLTGKVPVPLAERGVDVAALSPDRSQLRQAD